MNISTGTAAEGGQVDIRAIDLFQIGGQALTPRLLGWRFWWTTMRAARSAGIADEHDYLGPLFRDSHWSVAEEAVARPVSGRTGRWLVLVFRHGPRCVEREPGGTKGFPIGLVSTHESTGADATEPYGKTRSADIVAIGSSSGASGRKPVHRRRLTLMPQTRCRAPSSRRVVGRT